MSLMDDSYITSIIEMMEKSFGVTLDHDTITSIANNIAEQVGNAEYNVDPALAAKFMNSILNQVMKKYNPQATNPNNVMVSAPTQVPNYSSTAWQYSYACPCCPATWY